MSGYDQDVEAARGLVYEAGAAVGKLRRDASAVKGTPVQKFQNLQERWALARQAFDCVHRLRSVQAKSVATWVEIKDRSRRRRRVVAVASMRPSPQR